MTCREKYVLDNAVRFAGDVIPPGCPDDYGYLKSTDVSDEFGYCLRSCESCWGMEISEIDETAKAKFIRNPKEIEKENKRLITENVKLVAENARLNAELEKLAGGKD